MKLNKIIKLATTYNRLCEASIRSDMAQRIMHSVLPSVVPRAQVETTEGAISYRDLNYAIEGRKKIIEYGLIACKDEMRHCKDTKLSKLFMNLNKENLLADKIKYVQECINAFSKENLWEEYYGGFSWEKIAKSLKRIIQLDIGLDEKRKEISTLDADKETARKEELHIMRQLLMELNVFDGLIHNTGSIMDKIIDIESRPSFNVNFDLEENYNNFSLYDIIGNVLLSCTKFLANYDKFFAELKKDKNTIMNDRLDIVEKCISTLIQQISTHQDDVFFQDEYANFWLNAANKVKELIRLDNQLSIAKLSNNTNNKNKLLLLIDNSRKDLYTMLNSNYGLINSIFDDEEAIRSNTAQRKKIEEKEKVKRLMDAKELNNPVDVFRQIEPTLRESNEIHKFKDYVTELKRHPDYQKDNQLEINNELFFVQLRKIINSNYANTLNECLTKLKNNHIWLNNNYSEIYKHIFKIMSIADHFIKSISYNVVMSKISKEQNDIFTNIQKIYNKLSNIRYDLQTEFNSKQSNVSESNTESYLMKFKDETINQCTLLVNSILLI